MSLTTREQRVNPVLTGRPTPEHETNPGAYSIFHAAYLREGMEVVNLGQIERLERTGAFVTITWHSLVWDLETGTGANLEHTLTYHNAEEVMVVTPHFQRP